MKVLITGPELATAAMEILKQNMVEIYTLQPYSPASQVQEIVEREQVDAIIVRMGDITKDVIEASQNLRVIAKHGVGVNNIDVDAATSLGIPVLITPAANSQAVAEHTLALILSLLKNITYLDKKLRDGVWEKASVKGIELFEKHVGMVGFGNIGRYLLTLLRPFNVRISVFDPYFKNNFQDVVQVERLEQLLPEVDILTLHCPLTPKTHNLIGRNELRLMKNSAYLINTARGGVVDETALIIALKDGTIAGAGLDTFATEPPGKDNPLWSLTNVVLTPHVGGVTEESLVRMGVKAVQNVLGVLTGNNVDPDCLVNPKIHENQKK